MNQAGRIHYRKPGVGVQPASEIRKRTELTYRHRGTRDFLASNCYVQLRLYCMPFGPLFGPVSESAHRKIEAIALLNGTALISQATVF